MKEEKKLVIALWVTVIAVLLSAILLLSVIISSTKKAADAVKYDLNCVTESNEKPLTECKTK